MPIQAMKCWTIVAAICVLSSCASGHSYESYKFNQTGVKSTFEKVLALAVAGEPDYQNQLGFMLVFGEETDIDILEAHYWFHLAAEAGHALAQKNDAYMHTWLEVPTKDALTPSETSLEKNISRVQGKPAEMDRRAEITVDLGPERLARSEKNYLVFCGGCHGFNGIAAFASSPSFAMNERMEKSDHELFQNVSDGIGGCPSWGNTLPDLDIRDMITFARTLNRPYEMGIAQTIREAPEQYFLFGVMSPDFEYRQH